MQDQTATETTVVKDPVREVFDLILTNAKRELEAHEDGYEYRVEMLIRTLTYIATAPKAGG